MYFAGFEAVMVVVVLGLQILLCDDGGCFSSTLGSYLHLSKRRKASLQKWAAEIAATGT